MAVLISPAVALSLYLSLHARTCTVGCVVSGASCGMVHVGLLGYVVLLAAIA